MATTMLLAAAAILWEPSIHSLRAPYYLQDLPQSQFQHILHLHQPRYVNVCHVSQLNYFQAFSAKTQKVKIQVTSQKKQSEKKDEKKQKETRQIAKNAKIGENKPIAGAGAEDLEKRVKKAKIRRRTHQREEEKKDMVKEEYKG
ncbi:uncharacterized protein F5891DRAFT_984337 [Suillus fuscotomentosus]|uniref:Uncharacterized protein n=1 Tax=Suillus fuscotomentosus TaxID=1912939 RepID=A0AAD4DW97_9AGAM|nr:uncharacterized protein F5891DRAFT_984337 [Suillus fuscotomentosus]KAG1895255.1 hypothetical protein F5891DRAFT_984337 [Suillus fuscotomentosus]